MVKKNFVVHWLIPQKGGPIKSGPWIASDGTILSEKKEHAIACSPRKMLGLDRFSTNEARLVTCKKCKKHDEYDKIIKMYTSETGTSYVRHLISKINDQSGH